MFELLTFYWQLSEPMAFPSLGLPSMYKSLPEGQYTQLPYSLVSEPPFSFQFLAEKLLWTELMVARETQSNDTVPTLGNRITYQEKQDVISSM
jgi:hypothetical protein